MAGRDIVVVGASAGGVEALLELVSGLPSDFPAAVLVVLHLGPTAKTRLPYLLSSRGPLPAAHAEHGQVIAPGHVYVAPLDRHLLIEDGGVVLTHGPRENGFRPAIDPLFRSAAQAYGPRVTGIVLSGLLSDGSLGLAAIKARGGIAIVQTPQDALFDGMPRTALRQVRADYVLPAAAIPEVLAHVAGKPMAERGVEPMDEIERKMAQVMEADITAQARDGKSGQLTVYSCPDCGGTLWQAGADTALDFSCHVGHRWSADAMLQRKSEELESRLWACVRTLREKETLTRQLAARVRGKGHADLAARIEALAQGDEAYIATLQQMLSAVSGNPMLQAAEVSELLETLESDEPPGIGK